MIAKLPLRCWLRAVAMAGIVLAPAIAIAAATTETAIFSFPKNATPSGDLIAVDGVIYGVTSSGGAYGYGSIYSLTVQGRFTTLYSFNESDKLGFQPKVGLLKWHKDLFGATANGPSGGTVFRLSPNGHAKLIADFGLVSSLIYLHGIFYGSNGGSIIALTPQGTVTTLYTFGSGANTPTSGKLAPLDGTLYGTTIYNAGSDNGTVYSVTPQGNFQVVHAFSGGDDGSYPSSGLVAYHGELYGETYHGGKHNRGTVYKITPQGVETVLHSFDTKVDGEAPGNGLLRVGHTFYGTDFGGPEDQGNVFSMTSRGKTAILYSFGQGPGKNGRQPNSGLIQIGNVLYGTARRGGANASGVVYAVTP